MVLTAAASSVLHLLKAVLVLLSLRVVAVLVSVKWVFAVDASASVASSLVAAVVVFLVALFVVAASPASETTSFKPSILVGVLCRVVVLVVTEGTTPTAVAAFVILSVTGVGLASIPTVSSALVVAAVLPVVLFDKVFLFLLPVV